MPGTNPYVTESADTSEEAERVFLELARRRTVAERSGRLWALNRYVHDLAFDAMRRKFPALTDDEIRFRLTAQRLGPELTLAAYGRLPATEAP